MGSGAVRQCFLRYRERLLVNDRQSRQTIESRRSRHRPCVDRRAQESRLLAERLIEFTASSALVNQAQERQDAVQLYQILKATTRASPEHDDRRSEPAGAARDQDVAAKIVKAGGEAVERTIRTFDKVRDPRAFIIELDSQVDQAVGGVPPDLMAQLAGILGLNTNKP